MFVFDVPGVDLVAVDTATTISAIEEVLVDTLVGVAVLEELLVDTLVGVAVLEELLVDTATTISAIEEVLVDTATTISAIEEVLVDARVLVNPSAFVHAAGAIYFSIHPSRPAGREILRRQVRRFDSTGAPRVYKKGYRDRIHWSLSFPRLEVLDFDGLLAFMRDTVKGTRGTFTWRDHEGVERLVKFRDPRLEARPAGVGKVSVDIDLVEEV